MNKKLLQELTLVAAVSATMLQGGQSKAAPVLLNQEPVTEKQDQPEQVTTEEKKVAAPKAEAPKERTDAELSWENPEDVSRLFDKCFIIRSGGNIWRSQVSIMARTKTGRRLLEETFKVVKQRRSRIILDQDVPYGYAGYTRMNNGQLRCSTVSATTRVCVHELAHAVLQFARGLPANEPESDRWGYQVAGEYTAILAAEKKQSKGMTESLKPSVSVAQQKATMTPKTQSEQVARSSYQQQNYYQNYNYQNYNRNYYPQYQRRVFGGRWR